MIDSAVSRGTENVNSLIYFILVRCFRYTPCNLPTTDTSYTLYSIKSSRQHQFITTHSGSNSAHAAYRTKTSKDVIVYTLDAKIRFSFLVITLPIKLPLAIPKDTTKD